MMEAMNKKKANEILKHRKLLKKEIERKTKEIRTLKFTDTEFGDKYSALQKDIFNLESMMNDGYANYRKAIAFFIGV